MKKALKIFGTFLAICFIFLGLSANDGNPANYIIVALSIFAIFKMWKRKNPNAPKKEKKKSPKQLKQEFYDANGITVGVNVTHMTGLPLAEGVACEILSYPTKYEIKGTGLTFNLDKSKVTDVNIKTNVDIQSQYVSSIGGAVGGALLFGGLGAVVGGRAKEKKSKTITYFLIFTYLKDEEIKYASFEAFDYSFTNKNYQKFLYEFKSSPLNNVTVDL